MFFFFFFLFLFMSCFFCVSLRIILLVVFLNLGSAGLGFVKSAGGSSDGVRSLDGWMGLDTACFDRC